MERREFLKLGISALAVTAFSLEQVGRLLDYVKETDVSTKSIAPKYGSLTGDLSVLRNGRIGMIDNFTIYRSNHVNL